MSIELHADTLDSSMTPADLRFARRSARYLADHGLTPYEIRNALMDELDLSAQLADSIVHPLFTAASAGPALEQAA